MCVCVCVGFGVRCLVHLCISAYCLPCRHSDDIMAHDRQMTERIPPVFFTDREIARVVKDEGKEMMETRAAVWVGSTDRE